MSSNRSRPNLARGDRVDDAAELHRPCRLLLAAATLATLGGLSVFCDLSLHAFGGLNRTYVIVAAIFTVCLLGVPAGYWLQHSFAAGWRRGIAVVGTGAVVSGAAAWISAFVILFGNPDAAFTQRLTPIGSMLMALGMVLLGIAVLVSRRLVGVSALAPLVVGLYFPAQLIIQLTFFLGGKDAAPGPNGVLLGVWGLLWAGAAWAGATGGRGPHVCVQTRQIHVPH